LIAATAIAYDLPLYSCNPSDFEAIPRLELRTVPHPDHGKRSDVGDAPLRVTKVFIISR
jgi:hypothetical protein